MPKTNKPKKQDNKSKWSYENASKRYEARLKSERKAQATTPIAPSSILTEEEAHKAQIM